MKKLILVALILGACTRSKYTQYDCIEILRDGGVSARGLILEVLNDGNYLIKAAGLNGWTDAFGIFSERELQKCEFKDREQDVLIPWEK